MLLFRQEYFHCNLSSVDSIENTSDALQLSFHSLTLSFTLNFSDSSDFEILDGYTASFLKPLCHFQLNGYCQVC